MVNWDVILACVGEQTLVGFATGYLSGRDLTAAAAFTEAAQEVRNLLRTRGVSQARALARKAASRRELV